MNQEESTKIHIDNKFAQILTKNPKEVELVHVKTQDQVADTFTKSLKFEDFRKLKTRFGVQNFLITKDSFSTDPTTIKGSGVYLNSTLNWIVLAFSGNHYHRYATMYHHDSDVTFDKLVIVSLDLGNET
ncbi:hypothetical protein CR513_30057, partial [Mucuna pruriens]